MSTRTQIVYVMCAWTLVLIVLARDKYISKQRTHSYLQNKFYVWYAKINHAADFMQLLFNNNIHINTPMLKVQCIAHCVLYIQYVSCDTKTDLFTW